MNLTKTPLVLPFFTFFAAIFCTKAYAESGMDLTEFEQKPVTLVADEWCPQHCTSPPDRKGYIIDIVEQALTAEGVPFTIKFMPWIRAMRMTENGKFDGLLTPSVNGYPQFLYHSESVGYQQYCFYVNANSAWTYAAPKDLNGKRLGYLKESGLGELEAYLQKHKNAIQIKEVAGGKNFTREIFRFLAAGRADTIIMTSDVYNFGVRNGDIDASFKTAGCLANERLAVGLTKANTERSRRISALLDSGIRKLRKNGRLNAILNDYGIAPWPETKR